MEDLQFRQLVISKLEKLEEKSEKADFRVQEIREEQIKHSFILNQLEKDIPEIKVDLFEHKEGVIQNRSEIKRLSKALKSQDEVIEEAVTKYSSEVMPVVEHVKYLQSLPSKVTGFIIGVSKVVGAIAVIAAAVGSLVAYFY